ncbi:hypothetical protein OsJ_18280 [Oryza sativa Japonica Group]|uniref:HMA domain-containing protein n=1 Tax=Oryza sativa subsp. japonica TaxID=39947 RepID=B9FHI3_ORYSJ|nr:hypothetical protein OsJ_18280 [Oryza sativa Japonica Group]
MASESLQCKVLALRVSIHCEGCKKKVKKVLQRVEGVYRCDVDGRSNKATVTVTGKVSADTLVRKLRRAGKHAEQWPEEQQQQQPNGGQCQEETKNQAAEPGMSGEPAEPEKPASGDAAEPSDPKVTHEEPKKVAGEGAAAVAPAEDGGTEITDANVSESAGDGGGGGGGVETVKAQQPSEPKRRRKQQPPQQQKEEKAGEATMATAAAAAGINAGQPHEPPLPGRRHCSSSRCTS